MSDHVKESIRILLSEIVDYAGLFPPAALPMAEAVNNYAAYKNSEHHWMLGRFVVPVARLDEFTHAAHEFFAHDQNIWKLSVLAGEEIHETVRKLESFNREFERIAVADALEIKASSLYEIENASEHIPKHFDAYFELPLDENLADMVTTLAIRDHRAKIRTGGVTADAFPPVEHITRFIRTCLAANVPFKCTAGLHHPVRSEKPLTYQENAPVGMMHGFLNVFLAAAFLAQGFKPKLINELLEDEWTEDFTFDESGVLWRQEHFVGIAQLQALRTRGAISFGSCSFKEPIEDLQSLELL